LGRAKIAADDACAVASGSGERECRGEMAMNVQLASDVFLWCAVLNYAVLLGWFIAFAFAHDWMFRLHSRWFRLSVESFDGIHYLSMALYKVGILLLNLTPYIALHMKS
jgi:hypothetical protein